MVTTVLPKVKSSVLVPLLLVVAVCGAGVHVVGLAGVSFGYFTWSVSCEGVVTVAENSERYFTHSTVVQFSHRT